MNKPTAVQLKDPKWWDENFEPWVQVIAVEEDARGGFEGIHSRQTISGSIFMVKHTDNDLTFYDRPTAQPLHHSEPDRQAPEWEDWKIPSGSWPYWMLERMNRETGRMSYDIPVKGMIRDLWAAVSNKPPAPERDAEEPDAYMCPAGCGCLWRDNGDETMSLYGPRSQSCDVCEFLPLNALAPVSIGVSEADIDRERTIASAQSAIEAADPEARMSGEDALRVLYDAGLLRKEPES